MKSTRGSVLLMTLFVVAALILSTYAVYDLALAAHRLSLRNDGLTYARLVADSEMEHIYYLIEEQLKAGLPADQVPARLATLMPIAIPPSTYDPTTQPPFTPATATENNAFTQPFIDKFNSLTSEADPTSLLYKWTVRRSIVFESYSKASAGGSVYNYFTVRVEVVSGQGAPFAVDLRLGRHMSNSLTSIFQYNIFSQGDLQFSPDGDTTIKGDIAANGSIVIGADTSGNASSLRINGEVWYIPTTDNPNITTSGVVPGSSPPVTIAPPIWGSNIGDQAAAQAAQVQQLPQSLNLLGGLLAGDIAKNYAREPAPTNLFGAISFDADGNANPAELAVSENLVYRSLIAPPPDVVHTYADQHGNGDASYKTEYPGAHTLDDLGAMTDDPGIAALRAYNRAGLIVTINADTGTMASGGTPIPPIVTVPGSAGTVYLTTDGTAGGPPVLSQTTMYDLREGKNVTITDVDVGRLNQAITANAASFPNGTFNGVLYVYLANSSSLTPAAIRLNNGTETPGARPAGDAPQPGFTVATNGGIYVRGDYNTVTSNGLLVTDPATGALNDGTGGTPTAGDVNPAALMGDQITVLSAGWDDKIVTPEVNSPAVTNSDMINNMHNPLYTSGTDGDYSGVSRTVPVGTHATIAAGLLTGNSTPNGAYSGGGDNLVRFLEDWNFNYSGDSVNFFGSFGQLFQSLAFTGAWHSPLENSNNGYIYNFPGSRVYSFNSKLKSSSPPCTPAIPAYSRGTVFTW